LAWQVLAMGKLSGRTSLRDYCRGQSASPIMLAETEKASRGDEVPLEADEQKTLSEEDDDGGDGQSVSEDDARFQLWKLYSSEEKPDIFSCSGVKIANDGGVSDIDELLYSGMYLKSAILVGGAVLNIGTLLHEDYRILFPSGQNDQDFTNASKNFLLSKCLLLWMFPTNPLKLNLDKSIPIIEITVCIYLFAKMTYFLFIALFGSMVWGERGELARWSCVSRLCLVETRMLACFSALRLLYWVTPSVVGLQGMLTIIYVREQLALPGVLPRCLALRKISNHIITLAFCFIFGFDSFLVKYRMASKFIVTEQFDYVNCLAAFVFLFQMLGVVNLDTFVQERLNIFVFGGESGDLEWLEDARLDVWNAILAQRVFKQFGVFYGSVVMLGFDDYDFQMIVLDDEKKAAKMALKSAGKYTGGRHSAFHVGRPDDGQSVHRWTPPKLETGLVSSCRSSLTGVGGEAEMAELRPSKVEGRSAEVRAEERQVSQRRSQFSQRRTVPKAIARRGDSDTD